MIKATAPGYTFHVEIEAGSMTELKAFAEWIAHVERMIGPGVKFQIEGDPVVNLSTDGVGPMCEECGGIGNVQSADDDNIYRLSVCDQCGGTGVQPEAAK